MLPPTVRSRFVFEPGAETAEGMINELYGDPEADTGSEQFRDLLNSIRPTTTITIHPTLGFPRTTRIHSDEQNIFLNFEPSFRFGFISQNGNFVVEETKFMLVHELYHAIRFSLSETDVINGHDPTVANRSTEFQHKGEALEFENAVRTDLGINEQLASYFAIHPVTLETFRPFSEETAFTGGLPIDVAFVSIRSPLVPSDLPVDFNSEGNTVEIRDLVIGDYRNNVFSTGVGVDFLYGMGGNDVLDAGAGNDSLFGGDGDDTLVAGLGEDTLFGGNDNDALLASHGDDTVYGGDGNDTVVFEGNCFEYDIMRQTDGSYLVHRARPVSAVEEINHVHEVEQIQFDNWSGDISQWDGMGRTTISLSSIEFSNREFGFNFARISFERTGDVSYELRVAVESTLRPTYLTPVEAGATEFVITAFDTSADTEAGISLSPTFYSPNVTYLGEPDPGACLVDFHPNTTFTFNFEDKTFETAEQIDEVGAVGRGFGDPHLVTFDGTAYDFQASGDFILARATSGPEYEVQVRFTSIASVVSSTTAMATKVGGVVVSVQIDAGSGRVEIDGEMLDLVGGATFDLGTGSVARNANKITIDHGNGDQTIVDVYADFLNVTPT